MDEEPLQQLIKKLETKTELQERKDVTSAIIWDSGAEAWRIYAHETESDPTAVFETKEECAEWWMMMQFSS